MFKKIVKEQAKRGSGRAGELNNAFEPIVVAVDEVKDYSFSWFVLEVAGFVVEVGLVPVQLIGYYAAWLNVS